MAFFGPPAITLGGGDREFYCSGRELGIWVNREGHPLKIQLGSTRSRWQKKNLFTSFPDPAYTPPLRAWEPDLCTGTLERGPVSHSLVRRN